MRRFLPPLVACGVVIPFFVAALCLGAHKLRIHFEPTV